MAVQQGTAPLTSGFALAAWRSEAQKELRRRKLRSGGHKMFDTDAREKK